MKFFIVLFAIVAAVSAGYVAQPWVTPIVHSPIVHSPVVHAPIVHHSPVVHPQVVHASAPWVAPAPSYVKSVIPVTHAKHHAQHIHVGGGPVIPGLQAHPLALKGNDHVTRIHYHGPHVGHPHLVGVEHYNPAPHYEPSVTNVKAHGHGY